jgi:hypothetical protein
MFSGLKNFEMTGTLATDNTNISCVSFSIPQNTLVFSEHGS